MFINRIKRAKQHLRSLSYIPQAAEDIEFLHSADQFKQTIIDLIRSAKTRIYVTALYWQLDEAGQQILAEIYQAKANNPDLDVKILVDWHRAQRNLLGEAKGITNADWYSEERAKHGNDAMFFGVPVNGREVFGVLHIKGFVFDDTVLYSGASINNVYLNQLGKYRYDRYQKIKNGPLADSLVRFIRQYFLNADSVYALDDAGRPKTREIKSQIKAFRKQLKLAQYRVDPSSAAEYGEELMIAPLFGLGTKYNVLNRTIQDLFVLVQERLTICTPYFNFPRTLQVKIRDLLNDGKKVEIIVGDKTANDFYIPPSQQFRMAGALPYLYERNLRAFCKKFEQDLTSGRLTVRLWKDGDNSYHLKGIWVDDQYILLTGNNLNPRAWRLDAENGLLIQDPKRALQAQVQAELNEIRQHTSEVKHYSELEQMEQYPNAVQRLLKRFSRVKADQIVKWIL
ncbi:CDP-diacylglycerol--serine O-phosphatidyltransferase [Bisgaard Taxon 10/6]|uniref:CDP-diacylglycerol--serine O-phosphatidyltransferase n=1 Tax=Exercitatus varius TaxID=67857 RepID=UPI00294AE789|nr:CDP-diacylglycerol--serine O-phosphatidyltransferase [Exercitatus varius]MDG2959347.1 CDP-diacylglycerol--serine O-phosphatidyltransferase [Exercitatus varius]